MKKKNKGFTLIELLAVIVILGLLMAIAIPSVTKYITQSRKKTVVSTIGNYITAMVNEVNDLTYTFTGNNTIYAVPIECISLERGGTNPFGAWHQASNAYWAYVLVQYDDETSSYRYGYTFKDSAGYGLYPTAQSKLNEQGKQIQTGLSLTRPTNGKVTTVTEVSNWNGFVVDSTTDLVVLEATSEGDVGDGKNTCTLSQKGNNYAQVEQEKTEREPSLSKLIKDHNPLVTTAPNLSSSYYGRDTAGLYSTNNTTNNNQTLYFRGDVKNNYVFFAGLTWKIMRINEDGTIRIALDGVIDNTVYKYITVSKPTSKDLYYSNSNAKKVVDNWYQTTIAKNGYDSYVATGIFCEQGKVRTNNSKETTPGTKTSYYTPDFSCEEDIYGYGILKSKVGLINYDDIRFAGAMGGRSIKNFYLYTPDYNLWIMTPAELDEYGTSASIWGWYLYQEGYITSQNFTANYALKPVINLNADVKATGTGTSDDPYIIQTK